MTFKNQNILFKVYLENSLQVFILSPYYSHKLVLGSKKII